jgi:hypothetical protein
MDMKGYYRDLIELLSWNLFGGTEEKHEEPNFG